MKSFEVQVGDNNKRSLNINCSVYVTINTFCDYTLNDLINLLNSLYNVYILSR